MSRAQVVSLLICVACVVAGGTYLANLQTRREAVGAAQRETREVSEKTCLALRRVLTTFQTQEKEAGANARRLRAYDDALALVEDC